MLRANQNPSYYGNLDSQRVYTDCYAAHGDSGSLMLDPDSGEGIGIYMATVPDGTSGLEGLSQDLLQATKYLSASTYI